MRNDIEMTIMARFNHRIEIAAKGLWRWCKRPAPVWALALVAAAMGGIAWRVGGPTLQGHGSRDQVGKRWLHLNEDSTPLYDALVSQAPSPELAHPDDKLIPQRSRDLRQPQFSVYSLATIPRSVQTLREMGDLGQAEALKLLKTGEGAGDPFHFDRILVVNAAKGLDFGPADRMMWIRVFVRPINFVFSPYAVVGDSKTAKVLSVENTSSRKISGGLELAIPGLEGSKASFSPSAEYSIQSSSDINREYQKLGVEIHPLLLQILRESETGGDASDAALPLTLVTDAQTIWKRFPADNCNSTEAATAQRLSIKDKCHHGPLAHTEDQDVSDSRDFQENDEDVVLLVAGFRAYDEPAALGGAPESAINVLPQVPVPHCPLKARVWMLFNERRVDDAKDSYIEGDQSVTFLHAAVDKTDVEVMSADEVSPAVWSLRICDTSQCDAEPLKFLKASGKATGVMRRVVFTDYGKAVNVANWLRSAQQKTPERSNLTFNYPSAAPNSKQELVPFKNTRNECEPADK
jgi:hypothetical protein